MNLTADEITLLRAHLEISVLEYMVADELHQAHPHAPAVDIRTYFEMYAEFSDAVEELASVPHAPRYGE